MTGRVPLNFKPPPELDYSEPPPRQPRRNGNSVMPGTSGPLKDAPPPMADGECIETYLRKLED